jgi:hypothetical protein
LLFVRVKACLRTSAVALGVPFFTGEIGFFQKRSPATSHRFCFGDFRRRTWTTTVFVDELDRAESGEPPVVAAENPIQQDQDTPTSGLDPAEPADPFDDLTHSFVRLSNLPTYPLDRLSRYEATLWRQACQVLFTLQCLDRRRPWERRRLR